MNWAELVQWIDKHPALSAATLTGSVTFVAGISSQVLAHQFTKKREGKKAINEAISHIYSPLSINIYEYLKEYGKATKTPEKKEIKDALDNIWLEIKQIADDNKQSASAGLAHTLKQLNRGDGAEFTFFIAFFKEFEKVAKKVDFEGRFDRYTLKEIMYILRIYNKLDSRYGRNIAECFFQVLNCRHTLSLKKLCNELKVEEIDPRDYNKNSFDETFERLALNNIYGSFGDNWTNMVDERLKFLEKRYGGE